MPNVPNSKRLNKLLKSEGYSAIEFTDDFMNEVSAEKSKEWHVSSWDDGFNHFYGKTPKRKPITFEYIIGRIETQKSKTTTNNIGIFKTIPTNGYYTSYGIGFDALFSDSEAFDETCNFLDNNNINYKTEFSEAHFTRRIKISQSKSNLGKLIEMTDA